MSKIIGFETKYTEEDLNTMSYFERHDAMDNAKNDMLLEVWIDLSNWGYKSITFQPCFVNPWNGEIERYYNDVRGEISAYAQSDKKDFDRYYAMQFQVKGSFSNGDELLETAKLLIKYEKRLQKEIQNIYGDRVSDLSLPVYVTILFKVLKLKGMVIDGRFFSNSRDAVNEICYRVEYKENK